jgi:hypothetical protein
MFMSPVDHKALPRCTLACQHPAFDLHGYGFADEHKATDLPGLALGRDATIAHIAFVPPFAGACEVFMMIDDSGLPAAQALGSGAFLIAPEAVTHTIHVSVHLPSDDVLRSEGFVPWKTTMLGVDCWHPGNDEDVTYSRFYEAPKPIALL